MGKLFLCRIQVARLSANLPKYPVRNGNVLGNSVALRVGEQTARIFLRSVQIPSGEPVFSSRGLLPHIIKSPSVPKFTIEEGVNTLHSGQGLRRFAGQRV